MSIIARTLAAAGVALGIALTAGAAHADDALLGSLKPLDKGELRQLAGGSGLSLNLASNVSTVTGNSIGDVGTSGLIGQNSISNTSGLTTFIANSGNQVVISQSTVVNVYLR